MGSTRQIICRTGGNNAELHEFGSPPAEETVNLCQQFFFGAQEAVFFGDIQGIAERCDTARYNRDLMDFISPVGEGGRYCVPGFVIGNNLAFFFLYYPALLL